MRGSRGDCPGTEVEDASPSPIVSHSDLTTLLVHRQRRKKMGLQYKGSGEQDDGTKQQDHGTDLQDHCSDEHDHGSDEQDVHIQQYMQQNKNALQLIMHTHLNGDHA
jgi:hypothetical protein